MNSVNFQLHLRTVRALALMTLFEKKISGNTLLDNLKLSLSSRLNCFMTDLWAFDLLPVLSLSLNNFCLFHI